MHRLFVTFRNLMRGTVYFKRKLLHPYTTDGFIGVEPSTSLCSVTCQRHKCYEVSGFFKYACLSEMTG